LIAKRDLWSWEPFNIELAAGIANYHNRNPATTTNNSTSEKAVRSRTGVRNHRRATPHWRVRSRTGEEGGQRREIEFMGGFRESEIRAVRPVESSEKGALRPDR
jgi:hypothetical protein